jgi:hypothetical protein
MPTMGSPSPAVLSHLAAIGLVASFALPITSDGSTATKVALSISHVVVAVIIVPALALALPVRADLRGRPGQ